MSLSGTVSVDSATLMFCKYSTKDKARKELLLFHKILQKFHIIDRALRSTDFPFHVHRAHIALITSMELKTNKAWDFDTYSSGVLSNMERKLNHSLHAKRSSNDRQTAMALLNLLYTHGSDIEHLKMPTRIGSVRNRVQSLVDAFNLNFKEARENDDTQNFILIDKVKVLNLHKLFVASKA